MAASAPNDRTMTDPLFTPGPANDPWYTGVRDSPRAESREACEVLWAKYQPYADEHFLAEMRRDFHARFWEMYLAVTLLEQGFTIESPKPGPDVGIVVDGRRIWLEAVAPRPGESRDRVPSLVANQVSTVPNHLILLRYLNAIDKKLTEQYQRWRTAGIVGVDDAFIVAINPKALGREYVDSTPPRILQAAFPLGAPYVTLDPNGGGVIGEGYQTRFSIAKTSGSSVQTGVFLQASGKNLSGLVCSRVDADDQPQVMGQDFQLVANPLARVQLPQSFKIPGSYFPATLNGEVIDVTVIP
jgi:hypothetical protein